MDSPFDLLAKTMALAEGMPRREAVRRVGGALAAVALSSLGVGCGGGGGSRSSMSPLPPAGTSLTGRTPQGGGNSDCAHFCQQAFPPGPQRGQCVSDAAHGTGLCVQCNADITRLCNGVCVDLQTDVNNCGACGTKCTSGQTCTAGKCASVCLPSGSPCTAATTAQCCSLFCYLGGNPTGVCCVLSSSCSQGDICCSSGLPCPGSGRCF
jgi:hypothetical protein